MNRKPTEPITQPWQFYSACLYRFGKEFLVNLHSVSPRQIERWAANPNTSESAQRGPVGRHEALLEKLMECGAVDVAQAIVRRHAGIVGCRLVHEDLPKPDKKTMAEECLDDLPALAKYHDVLNDPKATAEQIRAARAELDDELNQNEAMIIRGK